MSNFKHLLGQRIRELRKSKGYTQEYLAEKIGIGTANISYIENGKYAPASENIEKLAVALGVAPHELFMFEHLKNKTDIENELFQALKNDENLLRLTYKFYQSIK
jgi:transcriptional regulator with XRE-family HTH domain